MMQPGPLRPEAQRMPWGGGEPEPLLAILTDDEVAVGVQAVERAATDLQEAGHPDLAWYLLCQAAAPLGTEIFRRKEAFRDARIQVEANGHEVHRTRDEVLVQRGEAAWWSWCHCGWDMNGRLVATETAAVAAGDQHIAETCGAWASKEAS